MSDATGTHETSDRWKVFVSYADVDALTIAPIVNVLRAAFSKPDGVAFWSRDSIPAGEEWLKYLGIAIAASKRFFVFWCEHSRESEWVRWEYSLALRLRRPTVPILLDDEPLPGDLSAFQAVDLRALRTHAPPRLVCRGSEAYTGRDLAAHYSEIVIDRFHPFFERPHE